MASDITPALTPYPACGKVLLSNAMGIPMKEPRNVASLRHRWTAIYLGICIGLVATTAAADTWIGRWASPKCEADATSIRISRTSMDLSTFDMVCGIRSVKSRGKVHEFNLACPGEGSTFSATMSARVDGDRLDFVKQQPGFEFDPKRYVRCGYSLLDGQLGARLLFRMSKNLASWP